MKKNQKILLIGGAIVFLGLIALIIVLIVKNAQHSEEGTNNEQMELLQAEADSLRMANDRLELESLTGEFNRLNAEIEQYNPQQLDIKNEELEKKYNEAKARVENLIKELDKEKSSNNANREKIKQLENEIGTLKEIARHYLEEIQRLSKENEGLRNELTTEKARNETLVSENTSITKSNNELNQTVQLAKKLNITGLSLGVYNNKDKSEKNITKAKKLGVSFTVSPNNTAAPGNKTFYVRIISPEGALLGGGPSFTYDGASVASTASRTMEYANQELPVSIYWNVNTTLSKGTYKVEVFCDGYRLGSGSFSK